MVNFYFIVPMWICIMHYICDLFVQIYYMIVIKE